MKANPWFPMVGSKAARLASTAGTLAVLLFQPCGNFAAETLDAARTTTPWRLSAVMMLPTGPRAGLVNEQTQQSLFLRPLAEAEAGLELLQVDYLQRQVWLRESGHVYRLGLRAGSPEEAQARALAQLRTALGADNFLTTAASTGEVENLKAIAAQDPDARLRLRAHLLLCEQAGHRRDATDLPAETLQKLTADVFQHLENHAAEEAIARFDPAEGFTHLTTSRRDGSSEISFLMENIPTPGQPPMRGGLNVSVDPDTGRVTGVQHWGDTRQRAK